MRRGKRIAGHMALMQMGVASILLIAVFVTSLIPSGYMPLQGQTWSITICGPDGMREVTVPINDTDETSDHSHDDPTHAACVFAGLGQIALGANKFDLSEAYQHHDLALPLPSDTVANSSAERPHKSPRAPPPLMIV